MAVGQRAVEGEPQQHHAGAEEPAADDVRGVVPTQRRPVDADHEREQHGARVHGPAQHRLADQHGGQHDQDARERGAARRVAGGERLGDQLRDGVLPGRAVPAVEQLDPGGEQGRRDHHADGEDGGPAVPADEQRDGDQRRPDRHPDRGEGGLDGAQRRVQPGPPRGPLLGGAAEVVEPVEGGALEVDQEGQEDEQRSTDPGPGQGHGAGAVEHGRQYAGRAAGRPHPPVPH